MIIQTEKQLHTSQSAAYFAQPVHSSKRSRSRVRPLNNIRSCCLPLPAKGRATALAINTHISKYARITARNTNAPLADGMQCDAMYTHETRICIWGMPVTLLENMKTSFLINSRGDRESGIWHARSSHDWQSWLLYSGKRFCQLFTEKRLILKTFLRLTRSVTKGRGEKLAELSWRLCWSLVAQIYPNTTAASGKKASLGCPGHQAVLRCVS